jgi:hypothetical protein
MVKSSALAVLFTLAWTSVAGQSVDPLRFPKDNFTIETKTVKTSTGEKRVTYRDYKQIVYVAKPVDRDYQSLNVRVPVKIDDVTLVATNAPILFEIGVGGYMSSKVKNYATVPPPPGGVAGRPPTVDRKTSGSPDLALAAGYVVVSPGCRGRDNKAADGTFYGKAPAAIVDLKAAVRYIRHNRGVIPGNPDWIFSTGVSAGGALSALLGASGNSTLYEPFLSEIGAADEADNICGSACFCPITDLEHADAAYEWMFGTTPTSSGLVLQGLSQQLREIYADYQSSLNLKGRDSFGILTASNYTRYLLQYYLIPSANWYLKSLSGEERQGYLTKNRWITWTDKGAAFSFADYVAHIGRMKGLPAFDDFDMKQPEPILFGNRTTNARHFTDFSLQHASGNTKAQIDADVKSLVHMMNPMYFIGENTKDCAGYWWIRHGTSDTHTSLSVIVNLVTSLENRNKNVNAWLYWDAGHGADKDPEEFIGWIARSTGFSHHQGRGM